VTIIAFGLTGDHMRLKIIPALFRLYTEHVFPTPLNVVGLSRRVWSADELKNYLKEIIFKQFGEVPQKDVDSFISLFSLEQGDVDDPGAFERLKKHVAGETLFYLSVAPECYSKIAVGLREHGFDTTRANIIIEKPFGESLASAQSIQAELEKIFIESQIYRVDHYLARTTAQTLAELPDKKNIQSITIRALETLGVEKRGNSYDKMGALRDVGQNHLLEMLAVMLDSDRRKALVTLPLLTEEEITAKTARAQYEGYPDITGVAPNSQTETYFKIEMSVSLSTNKIPVTIEAGKRFAQPRKEVVVTYTDRDPLVISLESTDGKEYETLIRACLRRERALFVSKDEAMALWRFVDPILSSWQKNSPPLKTYPPNTDIAR
jgi:glucose-6-phosphate 1-dehydrogenase